MFTYTVEYFKGHPVTLTATPTGEARVNSGTEFECIPCIVTPSNGDTARREFVLVSFLRAQGYTV